ncbi:MAG: tyrosine-type recombinase/integrase [Rhodomicrobium sp.]
MRPFTLEQIATLEALLRQDGSGTALRDLALLRVGIDSMLWSSGVLSLTVMQNGDVVSQFAVKQKVVQCELSDKTCAALAEWLAANPGITASERVFAITTRQHQRIVKGWCALLKLDGALYSTHSIRRTKPAHLCAKSKNLAACKELLGHANVAATGVYLGVTGEDARALARQFPI